MDRLALHPRHNIDEFQQQFIKQVADYKILS
jgi:hypothetical protein